jgi:hypothetical protein
VHADVDVAAVAALDREPVDELGRRLAAQRPQHGAPAADLDLAAPAQAADDRLDAQPRRAVELLRLVVSRAARRRARPDGSASAQRVQHAAAGRCAGSGGAFCLQAVESLARWARA